MSIILSKNHKAKIRGGTEKKTKTRNFRSPLTDSSPLKISKLCMARVKLKTLKEEVRELENAIKIIEGCR